MKKEEKYKQIKKISIFILIILFIDQISKFIVFNFFSSAISNEITENNVQYNISISFVLLIIIIRYLSSENSYIKMNTKIMLSFAIAGITGNLIDRIFYKHVITFIKFGNQIFFNFAYIYICIAWIGMVAILTKNTMQILNDRKKKGKNR